jgi:hypothetical protein
VTDRSQRKMRLLFHDNVIWRVKYFEISARTSHNLEEMFRYLAVVGKQPLRFRYVQSIALLLCLAQKFSSKSVFHKLPRDVVALIALFVLKSYTDVVWKVVVDHCSEKLSAKTEKGKCTLH